MLRYKTRILITHAVDFLDKVDRVIVMKQGRILHQGHFDELKHLEYFRAILSNVKTKDNDESKEEEKQNFNLNMMFSSQMNITMLLLVVRFMHHT